MATDIIPPPNTDDHEQLKFAINKFGKVIVRVEDECAVDVLNQILTELGGAAGTKFHASDQRATTPGVQQTTLSVVVPASTTRTLSKVIVSCRQSVQFVVTANSVLIGSGRTAPGEHNASFEWAPGFDVPASQTIEVLVTQDVGAASDVETYLMGNDL